MAKAKIRTLCSGHERSSELVGHVGRAERPACRQTRPQIGSSGCILAIRSLALVGRRFAALFILHTSRWLNDFLGLGSNLNNQPVR